MATIINSALWFVFRPADYAPAIKGGLVARERYRMPSSGCSHLGTLGRARRPVSAELAIKAQRVADSNEGRGLRSGFQDRRQKVPDLGVILSGNLGAYLARAGFRCCRGSRIAQISLREGGCLDLRMSERTYQSARWCPGGGRPTAGTALRAGCVDGVAVLAAAGPAIRCPEPRAPGNRAGPRPARQRSARHDVARAAGVRHGEPRTLVLLGQHFIKPGLQPATGRRHGVLPVEERDGSLQVAAVILQFERSGGAKAPCQGSLPVGFSRRTRRALLMAPGPPRVLAAG